MRCIRIAKPDGVAWTEDLDAPRINIGRDADNDIVLDDPAVSRSHCLIEVDGGRITVKDRGGANGTFLNNSLMIEPSPLVEGDRLYVGPFLLELLSVAPVAAVGRASGRPLGPIVRMPSEHADQERRLRRLTQWAVEWQFAGRPAASLLRGRLLADAAGLLAGAQAPDPVTRAFVVAAKRRRRRRAALRIGGGVGGAASVAAVMLSGVLDGVGTSPLQPEVPETAAPIAPVPVASAATSAAVAEHWVDHDVIPAESLENIARRYDVSVANVARWNGLNVDDANLGVGVRLRIKPKKEPLPQQQISFVLDKAYDWKQLSTRFDVEVDKLRAYNPEVDGLESGVSLTVWINPKPYGARSGEYDIPEYDIRPDALSMGRPNDGTLVDGVRMPDSKLYDRRAPNIMWGSSHTIKTLQTAIARFRQDLAFDGVVMVADISRRKGGHFPPHLSHQAGRDVDVWMPTLKGVYKRNFKNKDRKPKPNEIDWFATWGLVRALTETGQIVHIFLEYELQAKLHHAAKTMGESEETLAAAMQYPRGKGGPGVVGHSAGHTGHIHVRFKCGPNDQNCHDNISRGRE